MSKSSELLKEIRSELASIEHFGAELVPSEVEERAIASEIYYKDYFKRVLSENIQKQLVFIAKNANTLEELYFARGVMNAFYLMEEFFKREIDDAESKREKE